LPEKRKKWCVGKNGKNRGRIGAGARERGLTLSLYIDKADLDKWWVPV
jgi:hypothetical protein